MLLFAIKFVEHIIVVSATLLQMRSVRLGIAQHLMYFHSASSVVRRPRRAWLIRRWSFAVIAVAYARRMVPMSRLRRKASRWRIVAFLNLITVRIMIVGRVIRLVAHR